MTSEVVENTGESSFGEAQDEAGAARIGAGFVGGGFGGVAYFERNDRRLREIGANANANSLLSAPIFVNEDRAALCPGKFALATALLQKIF
jgi:hypothetical protein